LLALSALALSACKVVIDVPVGGKVAVVDYDVINPECRESSRCVVDIPNLHFMRSVFAYPRDGYVFVGWDTGERHLFGGETSQELLLDSSLAVGNPILESLVNSDETYYLTPIFALEDYDTNPVGLPSLYRIDCDSCTGPIANDWPYTVEFDRNYDISPDLGIYSGVLTHAAFAMYAHEYDYKIENLRSISDHYGKRGVFFEGLKEGQVIRKGEQVIFHLRSTALYSQLSPPILSYSFDVAGTQASFDAQITLDTGDRCPLC